MTERNFTIPFRLKQQHGDLPCGYHERLLRCTYDIDARENIIEHATDFYLAKLAAEVSGTLDRGVALQWLELFVRYEERSFRLRNIKVVLQASTTAGHFILAAALAYLHFADTVSF